MHGTQIFWKKSRIFRIIAVILPLPLLLLSFLLGAVEVSADYTTSTQLTDFTTSIIGAEVVYDDKPVWTAYQPMGSSNTLTNYRIGQAYTYVDVIYYIRFSIPSGNLTPDDGSQVLDGYSTLSEDFTLDVNPRDVNYPTTDYTGTAWCNTIKVESEGIMDSKEGLSITNRSASVVTVTPASTKLGQGRKMLYQLRLKFDFDGFKSNRSRWEFKYRIRFKVNFDNINSTQTNLYQLVVLNRETTSYYNNVFRNPSTSSSIGYNQDITNQILDGVRGDLSEANNNLDTIDDHLMNDNSGFSSGVDSAKSEFESQEAVANQAMDGAVHNYTGQLDTVQDMDFDNFWTNQSNTALFWRDVGEFILDPSNLGMFAGGLVIVSVMTLFVFMLRL